MKINEIFYSIQGEGYHAGRPAVFVRFSGCNLKCPFCDTRHQGGMEMTEDEIVASVGIFPCDFVVLTGGEPSLFVTKEFVDRLHKERKYVAVETNGTRPLPDNVDWVTISPKSDWMEAGKKIVTERIYDEVKVVFDGSNEVDKWLDLKAERYYLQPCDTGDKKRNADIIAATVAHCLGNPKWRISLQTQKIINVR